MKKWFAGLTVLLILLVTCLYIFIPGKLAVSRMIAINATRNGALRCLSDKANWEKWWPSKDSTLPKGPATDQDIFVFNGYTYRINQKNIMWAVSVCLIHTVY